LFKQIVLTNLKEGKICKLINGLDKISSRKTHKIGLLYVRKGQIDQYIILGNDSASKRYIEFTKSIGKEVKIDEYDGYLGGLDRIHKIHGDSLLYYKSFNVETIYHESVRIPDDSDVKDPQLILPALEDYRIKNDADVAWVPNLLGKGTVKWQTIEDGYLSMIKNATNLSKNLKIEFIYCASIAAINHIKSLTINESIDEKQKRKKGMKYKW